MGRCIYNKEWEGDHPWLAPVPSHPHDAKCKSGRALQPQAVNIVHQQGLSHDIQKAEIIWILHAVNIHQSNSAQATTSKILSAICSLTLKKAFHAQRQR